MKLEFKKFFESIGGGSLLPSTWTGSSPSDTMSFAGRPNYLPDIDMALPPDGTITPAVKKIGIVKDFIYKSNPITVVLDDGTTLYFTYDEYKRIHGDLPIIPKLTRMEVEFQRLPTNLSDMPSKISACKAIFLGNRGQKELHKIKNMSSYPKIQLF
jgi:hypothetical protein